MDQGARSDQGTAAETDDTDNGSGSTPVDADRERSTAVADTSLVDVSESRLRVLKALHGTRRTASELARELELNKSTVHGYLQDLVTDGFVERHEDEDRLWVYYSLTGPGQALVDRDKLELVVDLGTLTAFLASAALAIYELFLVDPGPSTSGTLGGPTGAWAGSEWTAIAYVGLVGLALVGLGARVYLRRRPIGSA